MRLLPPSRHTMPSSYARVPRALRPRHLSPVPFLLHSTMPTDPSLEDPVSSPHSLPPPWPPCSLLRTYFHAPVILCRRPTPASRAPSLFVRARLPPPVLLIFCGTPLHTLPPPSAARRPHPMPSSSSSRHTTPPSYYPPVMHLPSVASLPLTSCPRAPPVLKYPCSLGADV